MDIFTSIVAGFGLSTPAGLNAWLPLLITGLTARFTDLIKLQAPFTVLTETWTLVVLGVLLFIEIFADKIPAVDTINDIIHTFIRPVAGGILFAAHSGAVGGLDPTLSFVLGLLSAGSMHALKATTRPIITATTGGIGNPIVSFLEDLVAGLAAVMALVAPFVAGCMMAAILGAAFFLVFQWRARRRRRRAAQI
ncbi:MAG TPA: DUF4126 domain-containing protein [Chloroflexia bacterium]|nr:DUF4126 domain-containing protein [Chloroflexia bacterium]